MWNEQQDSALKQVDAWLKDFYSTSPKNRQRSWFYLAGYAGTGKTTLARHFASNIDGEVCFAAFTGKASLVMRKNGCVGASTIHSLIYRTIEEKDGTIYFEINPQSPVSEASLIIIDECSMVNKEIAYDLLSFGVPVLVLGDPAQLPPVNGTGFFTECEPDVMLTEIHRQAKDNPIIHLATKVRQGIMPDYGEYGESKIIKKMKREDALNADQIIVGRHTTRETLNDKMRKMLGIHDELPVYNDKLICLKNDSQLGIYNGGIFIVSEILKSRSRDIMFMKVNGDDENIRPVLVKVHKSNFVIDVPKPHWKTEKELQQFTYGYAITCHKCLHPDTLVETEQGFMEISKINDSGIISAGNTNKDYISKFTYPETKSLKFKTNSGYEITTTTNHNFIVFNEGDENKKQANQVQIGDWVAFPLYDSIERSYVSLNNNDYSNGLDVRSKIYTTPDKITEDVGELLGLLTADGTVNRNTVRMVKRHKDVVERFSHLMKKIFDVELSVRQYQYSKATWISELRSTHLGQWFLNIGELEARNKKIPEVIKKSPLSVQIAYMRGLFEDGSMSKDHIEFSTEYEHIAKFVHVWLLKMGVIASCRKIKNLHVIYVYNSQFEKFSKIGFISKMKNEFKNFNNSDEKNYRIPINEFEIGQIFQFLTPKERNSLKGNWKQSKHTISREKAKNYYNRFGLEFLKQKLNYHYEKIYKIENTFSEAVCVEVPDGNRFNQNGMLGGNSQGSQWDNVLIKDESWCFRENSYRWLYTALTRASEKITLEK